MVRPKWTRLPISRAGAQKSLVIGPLARCELRREYGYVERICALDRPNLQAKVMENLVGDRKSVV